MKSKTKIALLSTVLGIIALIIFMAISNTIPISSKELAKTQKLEANTSYQIQQIGSTSPILGSCVGNYTEITQFTNVHTALGSNVYYCTEHGTVFDENSNYLPISTALNYGDLEGNKKAWPKVHGAHKSFDYNGITTNPVLRCAGHYDYVQSGSKYEPGIGYVITEPPAGWTEAKNEAIWAFLGQGGQQNNFYHEGVKYKEFHDQTTDGGSHPEEPDIKVKDETNVNEITVKANNKAQTLIVGPLSMDYIYGYYQEAGIAFGGISDMYMVGYNSKDQVIKERIEITKYFDNNGKMYELKKEDYFEPDPSTLTDKTKQVYPKGKSAGEEWFELQIDNPNAGLPDNATEDQYVAKVKIHVEFKWMGVTKAQVCEGKGYTYTVSWEHVDSFHCHHSHGGGCYATGSYTDAEGNTHYYSYLACPHRHSMMECYDCDAKSWLQANPVQDHIAVLNAQRKLFKTEIVLGGDDLLIPITMDLGGKVWEDTKQGKENLADGIFTEGDKLIPNVKVTLFTENGNVATLLSNAAQGENDSDVMSRVNPTYTDEKGDYLFKGLDPLKKYYVQFEYNGQVYLPTDYKMNVGEYNTANWEITSKGTETPSDRNSYNQKFEEIRSAPENYKSSNSLGLGNQILSNGYNKSYSQYDLMGFDLNENGDYTQQIRLIDSFYKIENGNVVDSNTIVEGEISKAIREFILTNKRAIKAEDLKNIYSKIAGNDAEIWRKLQFIEDQKIQSYTQAQGASHDLYPVYDQFVINKTMNMKYTNAEEARALSYDMTVKTYEGLSYKPVYPGQFYINQGLWVRQLNDIALKKDVFRAATRINYKTEVYQYDKRPGEDSHWEIQVRMRDYGNYYGMFYNRESYPTDYYYKQENTNLNGRNLELYITYKITVRNSSQNIINQVTEVVDYYDKEYTYMPNLSWVMYKDDSSEDYTKVAVSKDNYYNMIHNLDLKALGEWARPVNSNYGTTATNGTVNGNSMYGASTKQDVEEQYNSVYVNGLKDKKLASGESAYIYLTFRVNEDENGRIILDEQNSSDKMNYSEINGYKSYYSDGTKLPNNITISGVNTPAGLIDVNSTPGNLCNNDLKGDKYEKNFEDDTDRAPGLKVILDRSAIRGLNGTAWEDQRAHSANNAIIGNGLKQNGEIGVNGVTVQLVEKLEGKEYIWQETLSGSGTGRKYNFETGKVENYSYDKKDGYYEFSEFIPGNYIVRFKYGHNNETVLTTPNGGQNAVSYNGQDFKSTVYEQDLTKNQGLPITETYNIKEADRLSANGQNLSDAKDLWENKTAVTGSFLQAPNTNYQNLTHQGRTTVNNYSTTKVQNQIAEILASPYTDSNKGNIQELINHTNMVAETATIIVEGEYNRTSTDGYKNESNGSNDYLYGNDHNSSYTINFVDFGLTERPKAQLEIGKTVTNVKITLANGNTLFDASKSTDSMIWVSGKPYNLSSKMSNKKYNEYYNESKTNKNMHRYSYRSVIDNLISGLYQGSGANGLIQATMDSELMHGARIQISYMLTINNVGETDYEGQNFYYKGTDANTIVTTTPNLVLDYVANNLQYVERENTGWQTTTANALMSNGLVNTRLESKVKQFGNFIQTEQMAKALKPGESVTKDLYLTQLITSQNTDSDKTYENITEIVQTSNTVGRRMAYSVVGNQDPTQIPSEVDSARGERVTILPPFGSQVYLYYIIGTLVVAILIGGVIFIKKKVL